MSGREHFQHYFVGADGSEWNLCEGPVRLMPGVIGLEEPEAAMYVDEYASLDGGLYRGWRTKPRNVALPVQIEADNSSDFLAIRRAWNKALGTPGSEVVWKVAPPGEDERSLAMRFVPLGTYSRDSDSGLTLSETYPLVFTAPDPYWKGEPIAYTWHTLVGVFPDALSGPSALNIAPSSTTATASVRNDGDVPTYAVWRLDGPFSAGAQVGFGTETIGVPFSMEAGEYLIIDTRPTQLKAYDHTGTRRTADLSSRNFAAIPPGGEVTLSLSFTGTGSISVSVTPAFLRAY